MADTTAPTRWTSKARYRDHHVDGRRYGFSFGERARGNVFGEWLGNGRRILDAGCRDGTLLRHYLAGHTVVGCDIDDRALRLCREQHGVPVVNVDLMQGLPFSDRCFDGVVLGEVLEHVPDPRYVLVELHRILRSGGIFVGSVPNALRLRNRLAFLAGRSFETDPTHLHFYSPADITALLEAAGFGQVQLAFRESRLLPLSPRLFGNTMLWRAVREEAPR
jgi:SAM-dependent methyltransferase